MVDHSTNPRNIVKAQTRDGSIQLQQAIAHYILRLKNLELDRVLCAIHVLHAMASSAKFMLILEL